MGFEIVNGVLKKYTGKEINVIIPDSVTKIGDYAFSSCRSLEKVVIPNSVTVIGWHAFCWCASLKEVVIPNSVATIGLEAFSDCKSLKEVIIPDSVTEIGNSAFEGCTSLQDDKGFVIVNNILFDYFGKENIAVIPNSVKKIGVSAFKNCTSLQEIVIPNSVKKIGFSAFENCTSLKEIVIPDSVKAIRNNAFKDCTSLEKVVIPDSVTKIERYAFGGCKSLKEVVIPNSATEIGESAFYDCTSLKKVIIPDSVTTIRNYAFIGCKSLKEIIIPNSVTEIGAAAFGGCTSLKEIVIPDSVTAIWFETFKVCTSLKKVVIPNSVTAISNYAFSWCKSLKEIAIPDSVTKIGEGAFIGCESLNEIIIPADINLNLGKKFSECKFENLSDDLNKYINQITNALFYLDEEIKYDYLKYKIDMPNFPKINIRGYEDIEISDEERKIISAQLKEKCNEDENCYIPLAVFGDDDTVNELVDDINVWAKGKKKDKERLMRVKGALMLNDTLAAQKYFEKIDKLELYAKKRNLDVDDLRDQILSDFGLDENGQTKYVLENKVITATLQNDLKFILTDNTGKVIKSISKKTDMGIKANDGFTKLKKDIKSAAKMTKDRMFKDFLNGKTRDGKSWSNIWLNNPVMKIMARLIVWQQGNNTFTLHDDNKPYLVDNTSYEITDRPVRVAHPLDMKDDELIKWREYFVDNNLKQPFEQVWEPVIQPKDIVPDRYKDAYIPLYVLMNKDKHGIIMKGQSELLLQDCSAYLEFKEGHSDWINNQFEITNFKFKKYTRYVNHIVSIFDKGTVEGRIKKDDTSVLLYLDRFTLAQIAGFIDIAAENKCTNVAALLLQYKQDHYPDYDMMDEFVLDL